jgi:glutathionylspermidine synthase
MVFAGGKLDLQVGDVSVLSRFPLLLKHDAYSELARLAELLHAETLAAEAELLDRPELHAALGLPRAARRALRTATSPVSVARHMRFDFHLTAAGWTISEVNSDVPGGFIEASALPKAMLPYYDGVAASPDPSGEWVAAIANGAGASARVAFVHATAFADDNQVVRHLADRATERGLQPVLVGPHQLEWDRDAAFAIVAGSRIKLDALMRFFPGEWLPNLPRYSTWGPWFGGSPVLLSNPASALLTQSKRLPLVWDQLSTPMPTWRAVLPRTVEPTRHTMGADWVHKPALGRVGAGVGIPGVTSEREWKPIRRAAFWNSRNRIAQKRFDALPVNSPDGPVYPCLGLFTIDGRASGIYGRLSPKPLIDAQAQDVAVLIIS